MQKILRMNKAIYIATSEANSGKSIVALGLMRMLLGKTAKVGYFRPIIDGHKGGKKDNHINTIISHFELDINPNEAFAFTRAEFISKRNQGKEGEIYDTIIEKYKDETARKVANATFQKEKVRNTNLGEVII